MFRRFAFTALVVCAQIAIAADSSVSALAPPGTRAVIGLHVRKVVDAPLVQSLTAEVLKAAGGSLMASSPFPGIDLKDIDEVVIVSTMEGTNPPSLVIFHGRFRVDMNWRKTLWSIAASPFAP
jgi:hypothetical protein